MFLHLGEIECSLLMILSGQNLQNLVPGGQWENHSKSLQWQFQQGVNIKQTVESKPLAFVWEPTAALSGWSKY